MQRSRLFELTVTSFKTVAHSSVSITRLISFGAKNGKSTPTAHLMSLGLSPSQIIPEEALIPIGRCLGMTLFIKLCPPDIVEQYTRLLDYGSDAHTDLDNDETVDASYRVLNED